MAGQAAPVWGGPFHIIQLYGVLLAQHNQGIAGIHGVAPVSYTHLVVEKVPVAENGEIVVALIDNEATVKRFYKEYGHFRLQPENDAYEPIIVDEVAILGKVKAVIREY